MMVIGILWVGGVLFASTELIRYVVEPPSEPESAPESAPEPEPEPEPGAPTVVIQPSGPEDIFDHAGQSLALSGGALALSVAGWVLPIARVASIGLLLTGIVPVARRAYRGLREQRRVDYAGLSVIGTGCELLLGYTTLAALNWLVFTGGKRLQEAAKRRAKAELGAVFTPQDKQAWVVYDSVEVEVEISKIDLDDRLTVRTGDLIPIDGRIVDGVIAVDQRALTGESRLAELGVGDPVLAATVVLGGTAILAPERTGEQTLAARLDRLLADTESYEQQLLSWATTEGDRSVRPTLALMGVGLLGMGLPGLIAGFWANAADLAWLGLPYLITNTVRAAAESAVVIKDGRSIEQLSVVDTVVFDKTGTLTLDSFELTRVHRFGDRREPERHLLGLAAALERHQEHPIAEAIRAAAALANIVTPEPEQLELALGYGLRARFDGRAVVLGGARFMKREGVELPRSRVLKLAANQGHSLIYLAIAGRCAAVFELTPQLRPEAQSVVASLQARGLDIMMMSGDDEGPSAAVAAQLGIAKYHGCALPEDKAALIQGLQDAGRRVCFIGDGTNDALALRQANVSVSMTGATLVASESAQILLNSNSLQQLDTLFDLTASFARGQQTIVTASRTMTAAAGFAMMFFGIGLPGMVALDAAGIGLTVVSATKPLRLKRPGPSDPARTLS